MMPDYSTRKLSRAEKLREIAKIEREQRGLWTEGTDREAVAAAAGRKNGRAMVKLESDVHEALFSLHQRTGYEVAGEDIDLQQVFDPTRGEDLEEWGLRTDTIRRFFQYLTVDGPHPAAILRRVFAIGSHMAIEPFCLLNLREKALMLGDSHGSQHWRLKKICTDPLLRKGARSVKAPGQKSQAAAARAAEAQRGNRNRANSVKKTNGHAGAGANQHKENL